ncbi:MAG TPA: glycosyltransferase family 1 protein [Acidimicrobiia bacterium]
MVGIPGIGRFITGLWHGLDGIGVDVVGLWPGADGGDWLGADHGEPGATQLTMRARPFLPREQLAVPLALRRIRPDVHHATHFNVPYATRVPIVLTIYDLIIYRDPSMARSRAAGVYYRMAVPLAVRRASVVVALSPFTARQLSDSFHIGEDRLRVVEAGLDHEFWNPASECAVDAVRSRYSLPREYLLYVGTAKLHKNLATLLAAHNASHPPLVLAGPTRDELAANGIVAEPDDPHLVVLGRVPDDVLPALYTGARALLLPSLREGLGLTALEAMACGAPVVASDGGALPETVGDAGVVVPARDVAAWVEALDTVSGDDSLCRELVERGHRLVCTRDWKECARQYVDVYHEAAQR